MKNLIIIAILGLVSSSVMAAYVPTQWIEDNKNNKNSSQEEVMFEKELGFIFDQQLQGLEENEDNSKALPYGFQFSHYVTDFSVSKSGLFGFSAYKAKSALEVKWSKKKNKALEKQSEENVISFSGTSDEDFSQLSKRVISVAKASGKIKNHKNLESQVNKTVKRLKYVIQSTENKTFTNWDLKGMRVELTFSATGKVLWIASATGSLRIRLEWKKKKIEKLAHTKRRVYISNVTNMLLYDLDKILPQKNLGEFKVKGVNVGVGVSYKGGILGIASAKTGFIGFLSFKPVKNKIVDSNISNEIAEGDIPVITDESNEKVFGRFKRFSRNRFRNGLRRSLGTVKSFSRAAARSGKNWEVNSLKAVFDLSRSGFLGLSRVSGKSVIEIELKR